jgi:hypothetical protein
MVPQVVVFTTGIAVVIIVAVDRTIVTLVVGRVLTTRAVTVRAVLASIAPDAVSLLPAGLNNHRAVRVHQRCGSLSKHAAREWSHQRTNCSWPLAWTAGDGPRCGCRCGRTRDHRRHARHWQ